MALITLIWGDHGTIMAAVTVGVGYYRQHATEATCKSKEQRDRHPASSVPFPGGVACLGEVVYNQVTGKGHSLQLIARAMM